MNKRKTGMKIRKPSMKKLILFVTVILTVLVTALLTAHLLMPSGYVADIRLGPRCTLADAIIAANHDRPEGDCPAGSGADIIALTQDIRLRDELPVITSAITIEGDNYAISGDNHYRIFYNDGGALTINNLTMTKGYVEGDVDGRLKNTTANPIGGAIVNWEGMVTISDSTFRGNSADEWGGGAIFNWEGTLSISDSTFSRNSAEDGGAIYNNGELSISDSVFQNNSAEGLFGGAILNDGELSISDSIFSYNWAINGGAISNLVGTVAISDSSFSDNSADEWGGAIYNSEELSITNSTFSGNSAEESGGAIYNWEELSISDSTFGDNSARDGGAIFNLRDGELSMTNSIIAGRNSRSGIIGGGNACRSRSELEQNISNFIQDGSCSPDLRGDPKLGELVTPADGSPAYFPLLAGSRAIDAADDDYCPQTDQIGTVRPQGVGCDIGAIEYVAP